ncbi:DUF805 domain-containing protein [Ensifer adhaerens]|uniref:DUF805 domain-containing protein n=1 Tax=Ensifer adhaerens TaxID=106592 RepID=UPI001CC0A61A|nr:DUF805 domain-containing protein [Ensifer adhaerens]MBZ7922097.1 DUF805 domain-containing protein [Ensifer adhaerens]UAX94483.1 DUF805 domain-containing protein [Ensifer adhaerens]UAY02118.1 DUF805 domain-containing protein [Ensifer adhaerens]UAY09501.1 DUF805 domain-containing protein [Ensifer adhaerens]
MNSQTFTSIDGRIGRQTWWLAQIVVWIATTAAVFAGGALLALSGVDNYAAGFSLMHLMVFIVLVASTYFSLVVNIKRWHDHGRSGWWNLALFVPVVGPLLGLVMLGFLPGDEGDNRFGPSGVRMVGGAGERFGRV